MAPSTRAHAEIDRARLRIGRLQGEGDAERRDQHQVGGADLVEARLDHQLGMHENADHQREQRHADLHRAL